MSLSLRLILFACSVVMFLYVGRKIRLAGMRIGDGIIWLLASVAFIIISVWPEIIYAVCRWLGIVSPTNLVYLIVIAFLLMLVFINAIKISQLESRLDHLAQEVALRDERFIDIETRDQRLLEQEDQ